ncbi:hypothetical protein GCM10009080_56850 [Cupriavidus pauculus]
MDADAAKLRGKSACRSTTGTSAQRVLERLMQQQPTDVARFSKEQFTALFMKWQSETRDQHTSLSYDSWMDIRFLQGPSATAAFRHGSLVFDLIHGLLYEARGKEREQRIFRVQLAEGFPYVSFRDPANAIDFPWVTFPGVFTQAELMSLRRVY